MNINANKFAIAVACAFLIVWMICSLLVMVMPVSMSNMTGHMLHTQWEPMGWHISLIGVLFGGVLWAVLSGATAWLTARIYNRLSHHET